RLPLSTDRLDRSRSWPCTTAGQRQPRQVLHEVNRLLKGPGLSPALSALLGVGSRLRSRISLRTVALALIAIGALTCLVPVALVGYGMWQENQLTQRWAKQTAAAPATVDTPEAVPTGIQPPFATPAPAPPTPTPQQATPRPINALFALRVPKIG